MKINKLKLINDLNKVLPGISTGTVTLEGADTVVFSKGHIYSYNSAISVDVKESEETGLTGVVKGLDFYNCLTKLPSDEIEIEIANGAWNFIDGKIKVKINLLPEGNIFERFDSLAPNNHWIEIDGKDFQNALKVCNMPKNSSKFAGIYGTGNTFLSTDSFIMNRYTTKHQYPVFWIDNNSVAELMKWDNFTHVEMNKMWLQFKSVDETVFSVRTLATEGFPIERINEVLENSIQTVPEFESEFSSEFYDAINRAATFSGESDKHEVVNFDITSTGSKVSSERVSGAYEEVIENIKTEGPEFNIKLDIHTISECASLFSKFKLLKSGSYFRILFVQDSALKLFSTVM